MARAGASKRERAASGSEDEGSGSDYHDSGSEHVARARVAPLPRATGRRGGPPPPAPGPLPADDDDDEGGTPGELEAQLGNSLISLDASGGFGAAASAVAFATSQAAAANAKKGAPGERKKLEIAFVNDKARRHITFSKRKAGILKKRQAYELSILTGTQVLLLIVSETGVVYTYSTPKLRSIVQEDRGKNLIQACLARAAEQPGEAFQGGKHVQGGVVALKAVMPGAPSRGGSLPGRAARPRAQRTASGSSAKSAGGRGSKKSATPPVPVVVQPSIEQPQVPIMPELQVGLPPHLMQANALPPMPENGAYDQSGQFNPSAIEPWAHAQ